MSNKTKFIPTGNQYISISDIRENDAAILGFSFLHMGYKGLIEVRGDDEHVPLFSPYLTCDDQSIPIRNLTWTLLDDWIPAFAMEAPGMLFEGTILAPINERGFVYRLCVQNISNTTHDFQIGLKGIWKKTLHEINESKEMKADQHAYISNWNHSVVFDLRRETTIFSFAPIFNDVVEFDYSSDHGGATVFDFSRKTLLGSNQTITFDFFLGIGFEEVSAATSAKEIMRQTFECELIRTRDWLHARKKTVSDPELDRILNRNMYFNLFFATGITLDTEELVLATSRSSRYYVSAAYWDRDSLLWSFPSVLMADPEYAREMLMYVFTRQIKNIGIHSRYIDGTLLEPGFELDELCAPIIALYNYVNTSGDKEILHNRHIEAGVEHILKRLGTKKHPDINLYETFLQPTDDERVYPYITYDNVLVWRMLSNLAELYLDSWQPDRIVQLQKTADEVKNAIYEHCVRTFNDKEIFVWSTDLAGNWDVYDEPPGSLQILPFYDFCHADSDIYVNTVSVIRCPDYPYSFSGCNIAEIGCPHAPHPWVLSIANGLLCGRTSAGRKMLMKSNMDNGIACESVDENTGESTSGDAFATCAGFLAYSIYYSFSRKE